jgi:class 3 adenylate cyclase
MVYDILCIGPSGLCPDRIGPRLVEELACQFHVRNAASIADAEHFLFENPVCLVIADDSVAGILEFLSAIKNDEMFQHVPVIVIVPDDDNGRHEDAYATGINNVIHRSEAPLLLYTLIKPLVKTFFFSEDQQKKISELQEAAIQDFILVDLIKDYIPKTIWDIAKAYAHLQKITIPEEETELTVVFADIKGFSAMTQHMPPREVIKILNTVFGIATRIVYESGGDIDKFIGDAFFAVYKDALKAVSSMVDLQRELKAMNVQRSAEKLPAVRFRIGIHTGPIIRGNVGGNHRYDNTLIGDTVNIASRLETIAPAGGILVSEETIRKAGLSIPEKYMRREKLRGRDAEDTIYEVFEHLQ